MSKASPKKSFFKQLIGIILLFCSLQASAFHIVGGEVTYECLGNGWYRFDVIVYKDCLAEIINPGSPVADFDTPGEFYLFEGAALRDSFVTFPARTLIEPNVPLECIVNPPVVCVEQGIYSFTTQLDTTSTEGFTVTYQRCCRNSTITNITTPNEVGATYTIEVTPEALQNCNNSPDFNQFPPLIICNNDPIDFFHSAVDVDGDSLVYEFCDPFLGGGTRGTPYGAPGSPFSIDGVIPKPAAAPPYNGVNFITPTYSGLEPMAGDPLITIDPVTGYIDGNPNAVGQYVVGVCVNEYRDGVLLSTLKRDFQFNVTNCQKKVVANIEASTQTGPKDFVIKSCGDFEVDLVNLSTQQEFIDSYRWEVDTGSGTFISEDKDITVLFPGEGTYNGRMILNQGTDVCTDTALFQVLILPDIHADFTYVHDSCENVPIDFFDQSLVTTNVIETWDWSMGDGAEYGAQNPSHKYTNANDYTVTLAVTDTSGCADTISKMVKWYPSSILEPTHDSTYCGAPAFVDVSYSSNSGPFNGYQIDWDFDGGILQGPPPAGESPTVLFENTGSYLMTISTTSPLGCIADTVLPVHVFNLPDADFEIVQNLCEVGPIDFVSTSTFGDAPISETYWQFGDDSTSLDNPTSHEYLESGTYTVTLQVTDLNGCIDTVSKPLVYYPSPVIDVDVIQEGLCDTATVTFVNNSFPQLGYDVSLYFGNGKFTNQWDTIYGYSSGYYVPSIVISSSITGCSSNLSLDSVKVEESPDADFMRSSDSCLIKPILFTSTSQAGSSGITSYLWNINNGSSVGAGVSHVHDFPNSGSYIVDLKIVDENGCSDSIQKLLNYYPTPSIDIAADPTQGCDTLDVQFVNNSFPVNGYDIVWNFGDGQTAVASAPVHGYGIGQFFPYITISSSLSNCTASDTIGPINVFESPIADFDYTTADKCKQLPYFFTNLSTQGDGVITGQNWSFGDGITSGIVNPSHQYMETDTYAVRLSVQDENGCVDTIIKPLYYFPIPPITVVPDAFVGCAPADFTFNNSTTVGTGYSYTWDFGDGEISFAQSPTHRYYDHGVYTVKVKVVSSTLCTRDTTYDSYVTVLESPIADFTWSPDVVTSFKPTVNFKDLSYKPAFWDWEFGDGNGSFFQNPIHNYNPLDTGIHKVDLIVTHNNGCKDTISKYLDVIPMISYFLPNALTPNGDGTNDFYRGNGAFLQFLNNFSLQIWNRWGEKIYETNDPFAGWNGRYHNTGEMSPNGVYVCVVRFRGPRGQEYEFREYATIVR